MTTKRTAAANSIYLKGGVSCSKDSFVVNGSLVFHNKFCDEIPDFRVAANRNKKAIINTVKLKI